MLLKITGQTLIIAACALAGFSMSGDYAERLKNLEQAKNILMLLKGEISYGGSGINEALINAADRLENIFGSFAKYVSDTFVREQVSIYDAWNCGIEQILIKETKLKGGEIELLRDFGKNLGITDKETQINNILITVEAIDFEIEKLRTEKSARCRMYNSIGVLSGVFGAIVLM